MAAEEKNVEYWRWPEGSWVNPDINWKEGKFVTAGVDVGSVSSQAVIMVDGELYAFSSTRTGSDSPDSARKCTNPGPSEHGPAARQPRLLHRYRLRQGECPDGSAVHH